MKKVTSLVCFQCGSALIELKKQITFAEHTQSSIVTTSFRCSSDACQEKIDKKMAEMTFVREEREKRELVKATLLAETRQKAKDAKLDLEKNAKAAKAQSV